MELPKNEDTDTPSISQDDFGKENALCLEEATDDNIPTSLKTLISSFPATTCNDNTIFTSILFIISVESGFIRNIVKDIPLMQRNYSFDIERIRSIRSDSCPKWNNQNFEVTIYLGGVEDFQCKLVVTPWLDRLIVNISHSDSLLCFASIYVVPQYVENSVLKYKNIPQLSMRLKDELFHPMKSYILSNASITNPSLLGLPVEIVIIISQYLEARDYRNLCASCKCFHKNLRHNELVWSSINKRSAKSAFILW